MRIAVFGGAGFVGSHVADALSHAGHDVTVFDRMASRWLSPGQRGIVGDILDASAVTAAMAGQEAVYSFAGIGDLHEAHQDPARTAEVNLVGCVNQLRAASQAGVSRFLFASTIYVYSEAGSFYRASKQACELFVEEYQRSFGLDYTVIRYGTLYGRRADARNSVHRYLSQALRDRHIAARGTGEEIREYVHVEDAARASVEVLDPAFRNQSVILTGHHPMRFGDLLKMIREIVGQDVSVEIQPPDTAETASGHYGVTPYSFRPKPARKLVSNYYIDMGQGLIDCLEEIDGQDRDTNRA